MTGIPLASAMILWTPRRAPWLENMAVAPAGSIAITEWPDDRSAFRRYPKSDGACAFDWQQGDDNHRLQRLADLIAQMIGEDRIPPAHVGEAIRAIDGIERLREFEPRREGEAGNDA